MSNEETEKKGFNWNWVALGILAVAYFFSAGRFLVLSSQNDSTNSKKFIRVAHWQLEPGYREALDMVMTEYNNLPHVKEAGIEVIQIPLPTRVYNQFMNVHLISGTAPDIASAGKTTMIQGNAIARFYASLGDFVNEPNPYNAPEFLAPDLDPELRTYLAGAPWKDTFLDGMEGGWKEELNDYFSAPISNIGGMRIFYNMKLVKRGKEYMRKALEQKPQPKWVQNVWLRTENGEEKGYLPDNKRLRDWLAKDDEPPETLGQFIFFCYAIEKMAKAEGLDYLIPISVGNYTAGDPIYRYESGFLRLLGEELDNDGSPGVSGLEAMDGLVLGTWSFDSPPMKAYIELAKTLVSFYPAGFMGLDREQTQRRFVSGDAAVFSSGSWDAAGVFKGAQESENPDNRFEVRIAPAPMPMPDERWGDMLTYLPSEANFKAGVPLAINKQTPHMDWALDFLRYISSQPVNEKFNKVAAWLPAAVGAETTQSMIDFEPIVEGYPRYQSFNPAGTRSTIRTEWVGDFKLVLTGELDYDVFANNFMEYLKRPYQGIAGYWDSTWLSAKDRTRDLDRTLSVVEMSQAFEHEEKAALRFRSLFYQSISSDEGVHLEQVWKKFHAGEPFPTFE